MQIADSSWKSVVTNHVEPTLFVQSENKQYQYLPIAITCAENGMVLLVELRHGTAAAFLGIDDDLRYLTRRLRDV